MDHAPYMAKADRSLLIVIALWFCVAKQIAAGYYLSGQETVFDLSFGFGSYVQSLYETGTFASCGPEGCARASRMPLLPLIYFSLAQMTTGLMTVTFIKNLLLSVMTATALTFLWRRQPEMREGELRPWVLVCMVLTMAPPVIKHASFPHYEEGLLLEMLFVWTIAGLTAIRTLSSSQSNPPARGAVILFATLGLIVYLIKSSMLLVLAGSLIVALLWASKYRDLRVLLVALLSTATVLAWGARNHTVTGQFSVMTSWDGSNAYRGWSEAGYRFYPDVNLDRLFDSSVAWKADGEEVAIPPLPKLKEFKDEWAKDDYLRSLAWQWMIEHPYDAICFTARKVYLFFIGIHKTPYTYTNDARGTANRSRIEAYLTSGWLLLGRLMELALIIALFRLWRQGDGTARLLAGGTIALNLLYAAPYLAGFSYERHVTVYLVMVAASLAFISVELRRRQSISGSN